MTPSDLPSGTDRIFHAYNQIIKDQIGKEFDFIVNLQGDVPNISPIIIQKTIQTIQKTGCDISTAVMKISKETAQIPSCVKAVLAGDGEFRKALYFSRQPVPHNSETFFEHIGLYVYTVESLKNSHHFLNQPLKKRKSWNNFVRLKTE